MIFIWATRGRDWGFRFLRNGGIPDPLPVYEAGFAGLGDEPEGWQPVGPSVTTPELIALRFLDPEDRRDHAGRVIPHEFVIIGDDHPPIDSLAEGRKWVWESVAAEYQAMWDRASPS